MTPEDRNAVIEEVAKEIDQMRMVGQDYCWWGAFWTYFNRPLQGREKIAAVIRQLKTIGDT